jgi:hypothetical protein
MDEVIPGHKFTVKHIKKYKNNNRERVYGMTAQTNAADLEAFCTQTSEIPDDFDSAFELRFLLLISKDHVSSNNGLEATNLWIKEHFTKKVRLGLRELVVLMHEMVETSSNPKSYWISSNYLM